MALTTCRECGGQVSSTAKACPACGARVRTSLVAKVVLGFIILVFAGSTINRCNRNEQRAQEVKRDADGQKAEMVRRADLTPEQRAAEDKENAEAAARRARMEQQEREEYAELLTLAQAIRREANDPRSIEIEEAHYTWKGAMMLKYRGRNAFGALVLNYVVVSPTGEVSSGPKAAVAKLWNRHIAHQTFDDYTTRIRQDLKLDR